MKNNKKFIALIVAVALQMCAPLGIIIASSTVNYATVKYGEIINFEIQQIYYKGNTAELSLTTGYGTDKNYVIPVIDENGFAKASLYYVKPDGDTYIKLKDSEFYKSFPFSVTVETKIYTNIIPGYDKSIYSSLSLAKESVFSSELWFNDYDIFFKESYLSAYVYKGNMVIEGVYIDGTEMNDYFENLSKQA